MEFTTKITVHCVENNIVNTGHITTVVAYWSANQASSTSIPDAVPKADCSANSTQLKRCLVIERDTADWVAARDHYRTLLKT